MINYKEGIAIISASLILAFSTTLLMDVNYFLTSLLFIFLIIAANVLTKKITAHYFELDAEASLWEFKRWGYKPGQHFKKSFPAGIFLPIISRIVFLPLNGFIWMASIVFDVKAKVYRSAKRHGIYSFSEISEDHLAYIASAGIFVNLLFAVIAYLIGLSDFAKFSIWFAFFNMIPISNLDGNKIFFGNKVLWSLLAVITLIAFGYTFLIV